jgi:FtsP/CotA-like multicopper oxidase with cupredoxin domain
MTSLRSVDMKRTTLARRVLGATVVAAAVAAGPLATVAHAGPAAPDVPDRIEVGVGHTPFLVGHARGVQIYTCQAAGTEFAWSSATPQADLYDGHGKRIITHFAGPTWQAKDGSAVVGRRVDGVTVDATAIPWLILSAASTSSGPGGDRLTATTFIQRINTTGGLPPAAAACQAGSVGTVASIPYTADYWFWKRTGA